MTDREKLGTWSRWCLLNLVLVAVLGSVLRYKSLWPLPAVNYKFLLNAHSHFAFNGWITTALFTALLYVQTRAGRPLRKVYTYQFWFNQVASFGMLASFTIQGYEGIAIFFSSLSIVFYAWFAYTFGKDSRLLELSVTEKACIRAALIFLLLSCAGPVLLGYSMTHAIGDLHFYMNAIYLFLHFQYNGWFSFAALGLFLWWLRQHGVTFSARGANWFIGLMIASCIPAYALSLLWTAPPVWIWVVAGGAGITQLAALMVFTRIFAKAGALPRHPFARILSLLSLIAFGGKIVLQALSAIPFFGRLAFGCRPVIIAYLHLVMLCFLSFFIIALFIGEKIYRVDTPLQKAAISVWMAGVMLNELVLAMEGLLASTGRLYPHGGIFLFVAAVVILTGIAVFAASQFRSASTP